MNQPSSGITVLDQLKGSPRFALFMLLMVPAAGTIGAKEAARLDYVTDAFGSALGIGSVGAVIAVGTAIAGSVAGPLCDRINPRGVLLLSFAMIAASNLVTVALLIQGALATGLIEVLAFWYGLAFGIGVPALLKLQAALVPLDARGSAEIINILRLSVGGIIGVFLARISPSP
ncbi:MAG: MFS transporter, partial [Actinobacteria bacterium]|nr:MFS transporter [Actinomycetota bacterium]